MKTKHLLAGVGIAIVAVLVVKLFSTRQKKYRKRMHIAEEGYETAEDILYPRRGMLKTGRVIF